MERRFPRWDVELEGETKVSCASVEDAMRHVREGIARAGSDVTVFRIDAEERGFVRLVHAALGLSKEIPSIFGYVRSRDGRVALTLVDADGAEHTLLPADGVVLRDGEGNVFAEPPRALAAFEQALREGGVPEGYSWARVD